MHRSSALVSFSAVLVLLATLQSHAWPLVFAAIPVWILGVQRAKTGFESFGLGVLWGVIVLGGLQTWILALNPFAPLLILIPSWAVYSFILGLPLGILGLVTWHLLRTNTPMGLLLPPVWMVLEWIRSSGPFGNPTGFLAYPVIDVLPVSLVAHVTGIYGVSLLVAVLGCLIWDILNPKNKGLLFPTILATGLMGMAYFTHGTSVESPTIQVATVQGNDQQQAKFDPEYWNQILSDYANQIHIVSRTSPDVILLPETILPTQTLMYPIWKRLLNESRIPIAWGSPLETNGRYFNTLILFNSDHYQIYKKQHLMPFGEYLPFRSVLGHLGIPILSDGDYTPGPPVQPLLFLNRNTIIGSVICLEATTPKIARLQSKNGSTVLFIVGNNAWFLGSSASRQFAIMSQYRAIETGRYVVIATNTGPSGIIQPNGQWQSRLPDQKRGAINGTIHLINQKTVFVRFGNWIVWAGFVWILGYTVRLTWTMKTKTKPRYR